MNALLRNWLIIGGISFLTSCSKENICDTFPCSVNNKFVNKFMDINYRRGMWVNNTNINERSTSQDTTYFHADSIWSVWNRFRYIKPFYQINKKKYIITQTFKNGGTIRNYGLFNDSATSTYREYDWLYDSITGYVYIDFNKQHRSWNEPIVYSRFIKISN